MQFLYSIKTFTPVGSPHNDMNTNVYVLLNIIKKIKVTVEQLNIKIKYLFFHIFLKLLDVFTVPYAILKHHFKQVSGVFSLYLCNTFGVTIQCLH